MENDGDGIGAATGLSDTRRKTSKALFGTIQIQEDEVAVRALRFCLIAGH